MSVSVKICGLNDPQSMNAAIDFGARFIGLVFCPSSPRIVTIDMARSLASVVPSHITSVGLFVDPTNDDLLNVTKNVPLNLIQLHGAETPRRVAEVQALIGLPVMKAISLATEEDLAHIADHESVANYLLFDTKVGAGQSGGTGKSFDWNLLRGRSFSKPWMLAGGLNAQNIAEAVHTSGATILDVSSGVEDSPGHKNPEKIRKFIETARML